MNNNKLLFIIEIALVLGGLIFFTIKEAIPEYKSNYGSSDRFINTSTYKNLIEINIDNKTNFGLIINNKNKISNIFFFDKNSICLYNQNIENKELDKSLDEIITLLIKNNHLKDTSNIDIIRYNNTNYKEFIDKFTFSISKYKLNIKVNELTNSLDNKRDELELLGTTDDEILQNLDYYSKQLISNIKNNISKYGEKEEASILLTNSNSRTLTDNVYKKIENYIDKNNINNLERDNDVLIITMISADSNNKYYPTSNSWYYVNNKKVYAYIELSENSNYYRYCYNGSIDDIKEGAC